MTKPAPLTSEQHRLVIENIRFATYLARELDCVVPLDERIQLARLGMCEAARRFDPGHGVKFATYSSWWIKARIFEHSKRMANTYKNEAPMVWLRRSSNMDNAEDEDQSRHMRVEPAQDRYVDIASDAKNIAAAMRELTPIEQEVIRRRYLAVEPETLKQIGDSHGYTREWVRLLEVRALKKLKIAIARDS